MAVQSVSSSSGSILIVIVNYKTPQLTIDCLHSLVSEVQTQPSIRVTVVDNDSGDDSAQQIDQAIATQGWHDWVTLIRSPRNGGYAFGNNLAIRQALAATHPPTYIHLLNPDTRVRPYAIKELIDFLDHHPTVGIVGSRLEEPDQTPQRSAFRFHTLWSELDKGLRLGIVSGLLNRWVIAPPVSDTAIETDWVAGASMMIRKEVFDQIGLIDEDYFMYYEEVDFCLQAKKAGWQCWYVPQSRVIHLVGQSSGVTNTKVPPKRLPQYWFESRRRFFLKNYGWLYTAIADLLWIAGFTLWRGRRIIQQKPDGDPPYLLADFCRNSVLFKRINPSGQG